MDPQFHTGTASIVMRIGPTVDSGDELVAQVRLAARWSNPEDRRQVRLRHGLSQQQLAASLGVTQTTVQRWEHGTRTPRGPIADTYYRTLDQLADIGTDR